MTHIKAEEGPDLILTDIKVMNNINYMTVLPAMFSKVLYFYLSSALCKKNSVCRELKFVDLLICVLVKPKSCGQSKNILHP